MSETYGASIFGGQRVENNPTKEKQDRRMKLKNQGSVVPKGVWYPRECGTQGSVVPKGVWYAFWHRFQEAGMDLSSLKRPDSDLGLEI